MYTCTHADGEVVSGAAGSVRGGPSSRGAVAGARARLLTASQAAGSPSTGAEIRRQGVQAPGARLWAASWHAPRIRAAASSPRRTGGISRGHAGAVQRGDDGASSHGVCSLSGQAGWRAAGGSCSSARPQLRPPAGCPVASFGRWPAAIHPLPTKRCSKVPASSKPGAEDCGACTGQRRATTGAAGCNSPAATCSTSKHPELPGAAWRQIRSMPNKPNRWQPVWAGAAQTLRQHRSRDGGGGAGRVVRGHCSTSVNLPVVPSHSTSAWMAAACNTLGHCLGWESLAGWLRKPNIPVHWPVHSSKWAPASGVQRCTRHQVSMLGGVTGARTLPAALHGTGISSLHHKTGTGSPPGGARCLPPAGRQARIRSSGPFALQHRAVRGRVGEKALAQGGRPSAPPPSSDVGLVPITLDWTLLLQACAGYPPTQQWSTGPGLKHRRLCVRSDVRVMWVLSAAPPGGGSHLLQRRPLWAAISTCCTA